MFFRSPLTRLYAKQYPNLQFSLLEAHSYVAPPYHVKNSFTIASSYLKLLNSLQSHTRRIERDELLLSI